MALYYSEVDLSPYEVPGEQSICIYISGCTNHCKNCQYPELQMKDYGEPIGKYFEDIVQLYLPLSTCVCFLGEGGATELEFGELSVLSKIAHTYGLKTCLYSGRDTKIESWMTEFDYVKIGSYQEKYGALDCKSTNQKFYRKQGSGEYQDITEIFWRDMLNG